VTPIPPRFKISQIEFFLQTDLNSAQSACDLPGDECFAPAGRLVIEKNSVADEEIISLSLID